MGFGVEEWWEFGDALSFMQGLGYTEVLMDSYSIRNDVWGIYLPRERYSGFWVKVTMEGWR